MRKQFTIFIVLLFLANICIAQTHEVIQPFGKIDTVDLRLTECGFEKGANAMILFDKAEISASTDSLTMIRHKRIKVFNDNGKDIASIRIPYYSYNHLEDIVSIEAQTINLENNTIVISKIDPKLIYTEVTDKNSKAIVFAFTNVKPGCIIEYKYKWKTISPNNFPTWFFQTTIPTRYSELDATLSSELDYNLVKKGYQPFIKDTSEAVIEKGKKKQKFLWAKVNIHSFVSEPFMPVGNMNLQYLTFQLHAIGIGTKFNYRQSPDDSWPKIARLICLDDDFAEQFDQHLSKEDTIINHTLSFDSDAKKIAYLFNLVKKTMKWNNIDNWYITDGVRKAWSQKTGSSTEINLILFNLLNKSQIKAYPMMVSTGDHATLLPNYASFSQINKTVVYVPIDSTRYYVLDASDKYNVYNEVPSDMLNTYGLKIDKQVPYNSTVIQLKNKLPALQLVSITGEIKPDSKVAGSSVVTNYSYFRGAYQQLYDKLGVDKYKDILQGKNNHLKISDLNFENMETDTLPLIQKFNFNLELTESDENYIYFNPNLFIPLQDNPFTSEQRFSDIDFGNLNVFNIIVRFKIPQGFKVDVLPKGTILSMADKSIIFNRLSEENDGFVELNYLINYKRSMYNVNEYSTIRSFYKKMYDMLNDPIVLKKKS